MALKGCDAQEHNVLKPTGNLKKETHTKALTNLCCLFSQLSFLHYSLQKTKTKAKQNKTKPYVCVKERASPIKNDMLGFQADSTSQNET